VDKIHCDSCKHEFKPDVQEDNGYQYFRCPECEEEYPIGRITPRGVELRAQLQKERDKYALMVRQGYRKRQLAKQRKRIDKLLKEYQKEYTKLSGR
jgi:predicted RNA-binding Zn-ribbon protein involved in translation (DUF1610 family)